MAKIVINNGPMKRTLEVADGTTLKDLKTKAGSKLSITDQHTAHANSVGGKASALNDDSVLEDGMEINFQRNTGQKG